MDHRIHQVPGQHSLHIHSAQRPKQTSIDFKQVLQGAQDLKISKHATERLQERNIHINDQQWAAIGEKVTEARKKGITDSLVIMNHAALLVSASNHTVVTAMDRAEAKDRIFTNINGTILMEE
ncbi:flagellar protein [Ornithinibacillus gellani]|uniref:TIGR02530 family flagellar biosynthesis protein n=1 Tax=Ornithinibacillus gellani TaxID=2293253 RepID=UPI000F48E409|nr:TIGR02530 family flagellar biosynthesis protein [Ornithinibacillus gellani]TQS75554.1 flagellar protein [Ornithinibacillus gellani]